MSTIPPYREFATTMIEQMRRLAQAVEGFTMATTARRRKLAASASVPDAFLYSLAIACDASPRLGTAGEITSSELVDAIEFKAAYFSVADELELLARALRDTVAERRSAIGHRALRAYIIAKRMNAPDDRALLIPHLRNLQRDLGRTRPRPQPDPEPTDPE